MEQEHQDHHQSPLSGEEGGSLTSRPLIAPQEKIIVVTGTLAASKSTVSHLLAQRFVRGVHVLQHMIVSGSQGVQEPGPLTGEERQQYQLRVKHMCLLGRSFLEAGSTVVHDDLGSRHFYPAEAPLRDQRSPGQG